MLYQQKGVLSVRIKLTKCLTVLLAVFLALWVLLGAFPAGWIYALLPDGGTECAIPTPTVITSQAQLEEFHAGNGSNLPIQLTGTQFIQCPLMGVQDPDLSKDRRVLGGYRWSIPGAISLEGVPAPIQAFLRLFLLDGFYTPYYLLELQDGSYVCVFPDGRILNRPPQEVELIAYVRRAGSAAEADMLARMSEEYAVNTSLIADMTIYAEHPPWTSVLILRLVSLAVFLVLASILGTRIVRLRNKRKEVYE